MQSSAMSRIYPSLGRVLAVTISLGQVVIFLTAGLLLKPRPRIVHKGAVLTPVEGFGTSALTVGTAVVVALAIGANLWVLGKHGIDSYGMAFAVSLVLGIALILLGRDLPSMIGLVICCVFAGLSILKWIARLVAVWSLRCLIGVLMLAQFALGLVSLPVKWWVELRA